MKASPAASAQESPSQLAAGSQLERTVVVEALQMQRIKQLI